METALAAAKSGLTLTLVGISIVFIVQTLITLVVYLMRRVDEGWKEKEDLSAKEHAPIEEATIDHTTLVLISAAVTTALAGHAFQIRRVRRLLPRDPAHASWQIEGRQSLHGSHTVRRNR